MAAPYGNAGCGLGSVVFGDSPGLVQTVAATTNGTFGSQTFGITSGTSNCVQNGGMAQVDQEAFMKVNYGAIQKEAAEGKGEHLAALGVLLGCSSESRDTLFATIQAHHGQIFVEADPNRALSGVKQAVRTQPALAASCARI